MKLSIRTRTILGCAADVQWWRDRAARAWRVVRRGAVLNVQGIGAPARNLRWTLRGLVRAERTLGWAWDVCVSQ